MIPLALVTGFLGSGKTTLLQRLAERPRPGRTVFVVNEFAHLDIDAARVATLGAETVAIPGGSFFCRCLTAAFINHLSALPARFPGCTGVVVEASGMADPRAIEDLLRDTGLDATYRLASVLCLADPASLPRLIDTLPALTAQIEAADAVLLNKCDLFDEAAIARAEALIRGVDPTVPIERTVRGVTAVDQFAPRRRVGLHGILAGCRDSRYISRCVPMPHQVERARIEALLARAGDAILRAKGVVRTPDGAHELDATAAGVAWSPASPARTPGLALIADGRRQDVLVELVAGLVGAAD